MQEEIWNQIYESCGEVLRMILELDPDFDLNRAREFYENQCPTLDELLKFEKEILDNLRLRTKYIIFDREVLERQIQFLKNRIKEIND